MLKIKRLCSVFLVLTILLSSVSMLYTNAQETVMQNEFETTDTDWSCHIDGGLDISEVDTNHEADILTVEDYYGAVNQQTNGDKFDIAMVGASDLPSSVDNSQSEYFPEIGNQGKIGSCVAFSSVYYQYTYEMNRMLKRPTTPETTFSTKFVYNLKNNGGDGGLPENGAYEILENIGCPYDKSFPYDGRDYLSWPNGEDIWREAIRYRIKSYSTVNAHGTKSYPITSPDHQRLLALKTALSNGEILRFSVLSLYGGSYLRHNDNAPENDKYIGEKIVEYADKKAVIAGHSMVIVGYNDDIWCDFNRNDEVDEGEMGALKIANSHGKNSIYDNKGFLWVAYDALNEVSIFEEGYVSDYRVPFTYQADRIVVDEPDNDDKIYVKFTLNSADRSEIDIKFSGNNGKRFYEDKFLTDLINHDSFNMHAFDGTKTATDCTFIYPLDDLVPGLDNSSFLNLKAEMYISDSKYGNWYGKTPLTIKDISIVNEYDDTECVVTDSLPVEINMNSRTFKIYRTATIRYIGFDKPNLHYDKSGYGTFTKVEMKDNAEYSGYMNEYFIPDIKSTTRLYFSDENGNIDDNNGKYYTVKSGINYFYTEEEIENVSINDFDFVHEMKDLNLSLPVEFKVDAVDGFAPYKYKYTLENTDTGTTELLDYERDYSKEPFFFTEEGKYKITLELMDNLQNVSTMTKEYDIKNLPFSISSVNKNKPRGVVNEPIIFTVETEHENFYGKYDMSTALYYNIKDSDSNRVWTGSLQERTEKDEEKATSKTYFEYVPTKSGDYVIDLLIRDRNGEESKATVSFSVYDKMIGDADCDGKISIIDATNVQRIVAQLSNEDEIHKDLADCDKDDKINIIDATYIQLFVSQSDGFANVGEVIEYVPKTYTITFINSVGWENVYCEVISGDAFIEYPHPGLTMTKIGENSIGYGIYIVEIPERTTMLAFNNGVFGGVGENEETLRIEYNGGDKTYEINNPNEINWYELKEK